MNYFIPLKPGRLSGEPIFEEVRDLLIKTYPKDGLTLGVIQGTEALSGSLPAELQQVAPLFDNKKASCLKWGVPFAFDYKSTNNYPHIGVFGGSGSGKKSFDLRVLIEELMDKKCPPGI